MGFIENITNNRRAIGFLLLILAGTFLLIGRVPIEFVIAYLLSFPLIIIAIGLVTAWIVTDYSNRDNIMEKSQFYISLILYFYTIVILLFATLVFSAVVFFPDIQVKLANLFTAVGFVLSFFAIGISLGYSVDNTLTTQRLQRDVAIKIDESNENQRFGIRTDTRDVFEQLQLQIQNQNHLIEEIIENNNRRSQVFQNQIDRFEEINEIRFRILQSQYNYIGERNESRIIQLQKEVQDANAKLDTITKTLKELDR
jgi:hypothetical protein